MTQVIRLDGSWVTTREAANMLGVSVAYVYRLNQLGALTPQRIEGRVCLYRKRDIEQYLESHPRVGKAVGC